MESPLEEALLRAYLEGVSTRRVGDIAETLGGEGLYKRQARGCRKRCPCVQRGQLDSRDGKIPDQVIEIQEKCE